MNKIKYIFLGVFSLFVFSGCLDEYKDLNTDPELLGTTDPRYVFTGATENFNNSSRQHLLGKYSDVMQYMQYIVFYHGAQENAYVNTAKSSRPSPYTPYYGDYFGQIGLKLRHLVNVVIPAHPEKERYQNVAAIANILETYEAWLMFDVNGAAPYNEGLRLVSDGIRTPRYDLFQKDLNGKELYKVFDEKIKTNVEALKNASADQYNLEKNDYFYKGDVAKWIKFGNTLRIKMAQRLEKADNAFYQSVVNEVLADDGGIISSNDESCIYHHPNEYNNNTDDMHILTYQYCASRAFVNFLRKYNDPRLPLLVRRNGFGKGNNNKLNDDMVDSLAKYFPDYETKFPQWTIRYVGMSANPDSATSLWSKDSYYTLTYKDDKGVEKTMTIRANSQIESRFYVKNGGKVGTQITARDKEDDIYDASQETISLFTPLITYPEVCFMMAEIAFKSGSAKGGKTALEWFRSGIRASMEQYQAWAEKMKVPAAMNPNSDNYHPITSAAIDAYLDQPEFQSVSLEKIATQQWVNLFMRPEEAWNNWKRTGFPTFKDQPVPDGGVAFFESITSGGSKLLVPRRCVLPTPNQENIANYNAALDLLIADPNYGTAVNETQGRIWWDKP
ncbi:MAG TPA: SusD/RagB family nutrient-binding outer membrane lipoprotein [Dysgonamonadaceae bacterium]|nr:SusD/RagB family nutrient-binding outer membrane lipoprotein [Dysgonamonadaceae bacterium]